MCVLYSHLVSNTLLLLTHLILNCHCSLAFPRFALPKPAEVISPEVSQWMDLIFKADYVILLLVSVTKEAYFQSLFTFLVTFTPNV